MHCNQSAILAILIVFTFLLVYCECIFNLPCLLAVARFSNNYLFYFCWPFWNTCRFILTSWEASGWNLMTYLQRVYFLPLKLGLEHLGNWSTHVFLKGWDGDILVSVSFRYLLTHANLSFLLYYFRSIQRYLLLVTGDFISRLQKNISSY